MATTQDDLGGTTNMLEGDGIGHYEKKKFIWTCVQFWMVTERELFDWRALFFTGVLFVELDEGRNIRRNVDTRDQ